MIRFCVARSGPFAAPTQSFGPYGVRLLKNTFRIIGDVHTQIIEDDLACSDCQSYVEIIANASYSVQLGDMGDGKSYNQLVDSVDFNRHKFFPGNHDHYNSLPPHSLGDFGAVQLGDVNFFFIRGATSIDRPQLVRLGYELGKTLWFEEEELTEEQMIAAEQAFLQDRPAILISHDAPTHIARLAWENARNMRYPNPEDYFVASKTNSFLDRILEISAPRLWVFGHHHKDWKYHEGETQFVCVGQLSYIDIDHEGKLCR